jgi:hypothetical protein
MKITLVIILSSFMIAGCSHRAAETRGSAEGIAQEGMEGSHYTALQFSRGRSVLTDANKKYLNELARKATRTGREISEIKILAWADREYPGKKNEKAKTRDVILANERANVIREFIRDDLKTREPIDVFNMAKKPGILDQITKDEEYRVKQDVAQSGVSATRLPSGETSYTKAGKVLVIIDYKENTK